MADGSDVLSRERSSVGTELRWALWYAWERKTLAAACGAD